jgi:hypothetical protein
MRARRWGWIVVLLGVWGVSHAGEPATNHISAAPAPTQRPRAPSDAALPAPSGSPEGRTEADDELLIYLDVLEDLPVLDAMDVIEPLQTIEDAEEDE